MDKLEPCTCWRDHGTWAMCACCQRDTWIANTLSDGTVPQDRLLGFGPHTYDGACNHERVNSPTPTSQKARIGQMDKPTVDI